jgi:arginyl-tRNA synthetase
VSFYKKARVKFDADESFRNASRERVVQLQEQATNASACHNETIIMWKEICKISRKEFDETYQLLGIDQLLERGESHYNFMLPAVVKLCLDLQLATMSDGAVCIFASNTEDNNSDQSDKPVKKKDDGQPPLMIQKSGGGYLYATTDLAALLHRVWVERADRILYVTDLSQGEHFRRVFEAARRAGMDSRGSGSGATRELATRLRSMCGAGADTDTEALPSESGHSDSPLALPVELVHVGFGLVLGEDGKKLKSRAGEAIRLRELLDAAVERARAELDKRQRQHAGGGQAHSLDRVLSSEEIGVAARAIGRESSPLFLFCSFYNFIRADSVLVDDFVFALQGWAQ